MTPRVTDHAVLRFLERAQGFDIEAVRKHIAVTCAGAVAIGASTFKAHGVKFEIDPQTRTVVTVTPGNCQPTRTHRERCGRGPFRPIDRLPAHAGEGEA